MKKANGTASVFLVKPFVVMAARVLGPGPLRLRMVKLAHNLDGHPVAIVAPEPADYVETPAVQQTRRAA